MFSGFRSRWMTPMSCATASAASAWHAMSTMRATGSECSSSMILASVAAVDVLHGDVEEAVGLLAEVDDAHRVRVVDTRRGLRLAEEARREHRFTGELAMEHLDRDGRAERDLPGLVDRAHRAFADERFDPEFPSDGATEEGLLLHEARRYRTMPGWAILRRKLRHRGPHPWAGPTGAPMA